MSGKTTALEYSLQEVFRVRPEQKNLLRMTVSPDTHTRSVGSVLDERIAGVDEEPKPLVIFVDDIHLGG